MTANQPFDHHTQGRDDATQINLPGSFVEQEVVKHALKSGYISSQQLHKLITWYHQARQQPSSDNSSPLLGRLCSSLNSMQIGALQSVYHLAKNAANIDTLKPEQSVSARIETLKSSRQISQQLEDQRRHVIEEIEELLKRDPHFSPIADLFLKRKEKLGEGGMGAVYRVHDTRIGRDAALKVISKLGADTDAIKRFLREVKITARLDHPSIPPVYDAGTNKQGEHYMLMRVIEGEELSDMIHRVHKVPVNYKKDPSKIRELLEVLVKVGEAVAYAHSQGILHRDLKPANILVGQFGEVMVMDWGLAKEKGKHEEKAMLGKHGKAIDFSQEQAKQAGLTQIGAAMGTPGYMPPEQANDSTNVDERADVFALAAILTQILTGKAPISGQGAFDKLVQTLKVKILISSEIDRGVPKELNAIAANALALERADRTASIEDFISQLKAYLMGQPVTVYRYSVGERLSRGVKNHPGKILGVLGGLLLVALVAALLVLLGEQKLIKKEQALDRVRAELSERALAEAKDSEKKAQSQAERAKRVLFLLNEGRDKQRRGAPFEEVLSKVEEALKLGGRSLDQLVEAARIIDKAGQKKRARVYLEEAVEKHPPAFQALFFLHIMELGDDDFRWTKYLEQIAEEGKKGKVENEYTLFARAGQAQVAKNLKEALRLYNRIEKYTTRFTWAYNNRGNARYDLGDNKGAILDYSKAIEINSRLYQAYNNRGNARSRLGDNKGAILDYSKAIEINPRYYQAYNNRGNARLSLGDKKGAILDYNKAIEINPRLNQAYSNRGNARYDLGDNKGAILDCSKAIEINPRYYQAYYNRGNARSRSGDNKGVMDDYNKAIEINPRYYQAYNNRGLVQSGLGDKKEAVFDYSKAIEINPRFYQAYNNRGNARSSLGDNKGAMSDYNKAVKINPRYYKAYSDRGNARSRSGDNKGAMDDYDKAIEINPRYYQAYNSRGAARSRSGDNKGAILDFNKAIEINPRYYKAYSNRGNVRSRSGDNKGAILDYSKALEINPRYYQVCYNRGNARSRLGDNKGAVDDHTKAIEINPRYYQAYTNRGNARSSLGDNKGAILDYSKALEINPRYAEAYANRGLLQDSLGRKRAATIDLKRFLELAPNHSGARRVRAQLSRIEQELKKNKSK